jgi:hypothetical protein
MAEQVKGVADIVFLLDASGSMQPCIDALKENIASFVDSLVNPGPNNQLPVKDWRAKVVGYRDVEADGAEWFVDNGFTSDLAELKSQIASISAKGGDDEPESLLDAIFKVASAGATGPQESPAPSKWRPRRSAARVVIAFTDATYKPTMSLPEAKGGTVDDVINICTQERIVLCLFCPEDPCYESLAELDKSEVDIIGPLKEAPQKLKEFTGDKANFKKVLAALAKTVSKSTETPVLV